MPTMQDAIASLGNPSIRHIVSVSGGKDSAALALYIRKQYPMIQAEYVFCDTGCELPETDDYLKKLEALLGITIQRLSAINTLRISKKNRNPFDIWLDLYGGYLPSPRSRWCTRVLKIEPFEHYVGTSQAYSYIGIRADEDRDGYIAKKPPVMSQRANIMPVYPFKDDGLRLADVKRLLEESGLGLPSYYQWRSRSGCYFCFYQRVGEWQRLKDMHPNLFEKAKNYERVKNGKKFTWVDRRSLAELELIEKRYPLPAEDADEGCAICHL